MDARPGWSIHLEEVKRLRLRPGTTPGQVPNGSFESGYGGEPEGWHLVGGSLGASAEWLASGGASGGRCLRISPRGGGASWVCDPIPVTAGREYLFRCAMKRDGNRHWAHACRVSWVSLVFLDHTCTPCPLNLDDDLPLVPVRCRKTADWVEAARYVTAPKDAAFLLIGFRIECGEPDLNDPYGFRKFWHGEIDTGTWWIDDVRLETAAPPPGPHAEGKAGLTIDLPQGVGRVRVADDAGRTFAPPGAITYTEGGGCFHAMRDRVELALAPGRYTVEVMRGFQRTPSLWTIDLSGGRTTRLRAELPLIAGWPAKGLFAGDHHNHLSFHGATRHPMMTINDACRVARGEGLDYLSFCGEIVDQHAFADWREAGRTRGTRPDGVFETEDFVSSVSHEVTQDLLGHLCLVNAPGHVAPGHPWWITPTNAELIQSIRSGDGVDTVGEVVMAHPYDGLTPDGLFRQLADPSVTSVQREMPVDVALGLADTMDFLVVEPATNLDLRFRDYFRLLNLGLRIGVSASSDAYVDQGTEIVGGLRTIVQAESLAMDAIALGYRGQRTMATNGPLIVFAANGGTLGDTVEGPVVRLDARAFSNWGLTKLELVAGGDGIAAATPGPDGWARIEKEVRFDRSGWLIAHAWGPAHHALNCLPVPAGRRANSGQQCVTSPIYVDVPGRPIVPRRDDAEYFIRWIDASCEAIRRRMAFIAPQGPNGPVMTEAHVRTALDLFARGRRVYEQMHAVSR
jgi:hypothetical protein